MRAEVDGGRCDKDCKNSHDAPSVGLHTRRGHHTTMKHSGLVRQSRAAGSGGQGKLLPAIGRPEVTLEFLEGVAKRHPVLHEQVRTGSAQIMLDRSLAKGIEAIEPRSIAAKWGSAFRRCF
jgi:hypothetical protein